MDALKKSIALHDDVIPTLEMRPARRERVGRHVVSVYVPLQANTRLLAEALDELIESGWASRIVALYKSAREIPRLGKSFYGCECRKATVKIAWKVPAPIVRGIIYEVCKQKIKN